MKRKSIETVYLETKYFSKSKSKSNVLSELSTNWIIYLMALPGLLFFVFFAYVPLSGIVVAFKDFNIVDGIYNSPWNGFKNFEFFFTSASKAFQTTYNTLLLNSLYIIFGIFFQVAIALFLNEIKSKNFVKVTQSLIFIPYFLSWVVVGSVIYSIFSINTGALNSILKTFGVVPISWYTEPQYWRTIFVATHIWKWTGYGSIVYLSTLMGIDPTYYEAAKVDGASKWKQIIHVSLPLLKPTIVVMFLLGIGRIFFGDFGMVYGIVKDNAYLLDKVEVIDTYVYRSMRITGDFSLAAAVGLYQSFFGLVIILSANKFAKKINDGNGLF
jgi:putative aldouronate transport system permease protein